MGSISLCYEDRKTDRQQLNLTFQFTVRSGRAREKHSSYLGLVVLLVLSPSGKELDKKKGQKCKNMKKYKSLGAGGEVIMYTIQ